MALTKCKDCGAEVSKRAKKCPKCGAPVKRGSFEGCGCLLGIAVLVALGLFIFFWIDSDPERSVSNSTPREQNTMDVSVGWNDTVLQLSNNGTRALEGEIVIIYINGQPPYAYKATIEGPAIDTSVRIPLNEFIDRNGNRFNPYAQAVTEAWVGGSGYDYMQFH